MERIRNLRLAGRWIAGSLLWLTAVSPLAAQNGSGAPSLSGEGAAAGLRPELSVSKALYQPGEPVMVRFMLVNSSDQPIDLIAVDDRQETDSTGLPPAVVFGFDQEHAVFIAYEDEPSTPLARPTAAEDRNPRHERSLRVGQRSLIGTELDLATLHKGLRYSGEYRLEWRPLGGKHGTATAVFRVEQRQSVLFVTDLGRMTFTLAYEEAPQNVANFLELVRDGFYDGKTFHRVIPGSLIQGGCPLGNGRGIRSDGKMVVAELSEKPFELGTLAMARKQSDLNSASCQFFISLGRNPDFDGQYTIVGQAADEESLRTLQKLAEVKTNTEKRPARTLVIAHARLVPESRVTGRQATPVKASP
jgi:cyclophilin family peptidyl-prolyl cis-trans isomerase